MTIATDLTLSPFEDEAAWDTLTIGGLTFTGTFEWGGDLLKRKIDRRGAAGRDGARVRDKGYDLAELTLTLRWWTSEQWDRYGDIVTLLFPRGADARRRNAHAVAHPLLALAGITEVYATGADVPRQTSPTLWEATIKLVEYRQPPPRNTSRTPRAAPADLGANRTAFTSTEPTPAPTPPATPGPQL